MKGLGKRFSGVQAWSQLTAEQQTAIGARALEFIVCSQGNDLHGDASQGNAADAQWRVFSRGRPALSAMLELAVMDVLSDLVEAFWSGAEPVPVPILLGRLCRSCGETERGGGERRSEADWAEPDLCAPCAQLEVVAGIRPLSPDTGWGPQKTVQCDGIS